MIRIENLFKELKVKTIIEYYTIFILMLIYIIGYYHAAPYNKTNFNFFKTNEPFKYKIEKYDANYSINVGDDMPLAIIPFDAPFPLDKSLYIKQFLCFFSLKDFLVVFVRTNINELKVITLKRNESIHNFEKSFTYEIYEPKDFFNSKVYFPNDYNYYYIKCRKPDGDGFINNWPFLGNSILLILVIWLINKMFFLIKIKK